MRLPLCGHENVLKFPRSRYQQKVDVLILLTFRGSFMMTTIEAHFMFLLSRPSADLFVRFLSRYQQEQNSSNMFMADAEADWFSFIDLSTQ